MKVIVGLLYLAFVLLLLASTVYGLYLAFSASIILGIIVFICEPSPAVIGLVMFFFDKNIPELLMQWLNS